MQPRRVFISGGTGYMGRALVGRLLAAGHDVAVLARPGSERKIPSPARAVTGNALDAATFADQIRPADTFVHLVGTPHPAPWKEAEFRAIDLPSLAASAAAASQSGVEHFIYVSVAQPAPAMKAYIQVRQECEAILAEKGLTSTILRPWYVLGPGHRWPIALKPIYALLRALPATREGATRLGLVTLEQMISALAWSVEHPPATTRILDAPAISAGR
jgi:uncharacterized protein YbjT (DUF2867 family)